LSDLSILSNLPNWSDLTQLFNSVFFLLLA
jgi:hypothetical protein